MLSLARDALERSANDANGAQAYLSERLLNDGLLREALGKAAIDTKRQLLLRKHRPKGLFPTSIVPKSLGKLKPSARKRGTRI